MLRWHSLRWHLFIHTNLTQNFRINDLFPHRVGTTGIPSWDGEGPMRLLLSVRIYRQLKAAVGRCIDIFFHGVATGKILIIPHISPHPAPVTLMKLSGPQKKR